LGGGAQPAVKSPGKHPESPHPDQLFLRPGKDCWPMPADRHQYKA